MAWDDLPPEKEELMPAVPDWTAEAPTSEDASLWQQLKGTGDVSEQTESFGVGLGKGAFLPVEIANKLLPGERDPDLRATLIAKVEKILGENLGDERTKAYYKSLSEDDLKQRQLAKEQETLAKAPLAGIGGELIGSSPAMLAAGAGLAKGAQAIGKTVQGISALGKAAPIAGKIAQAETNIAGMGGLGELAGIGMSQAPTLQERAIEALPTALTSAAAGGSVELAGLAARGLASPTVQQAIGQTVERAAPALGAATKPIAAIAKPAIKYGGAALTGAATLPLITGGHPGANLRTLEGGILGLAAPALIASTGPGKTLAKSYEYGKKGVRLFRPEDIERDAQAAYNLALKTSGGIKALEETVGTPANVYIQKTYQDALQNVGKQLQLEGANLANFLKSEQSNLGIAIGDAWKVAQEQGKTLDISDFLKITKQRFEEAVANGLIATDKQGDAQQIITQINKYLETQGVPFKVNLSNVENVGGTGLTTAKTQITGPGSTELKPVPGQFPNIPKPIPGKMPEVPEGSTITPLKAGITAKKPPAGVGPEITKTETSIVTPPTTPKGPLSADEIRQVRTLFQTWGFPARESTPLEAIAAQAFGELSDIIKPLFQEGEVNLLTPLNRKYAAVKQLFNLVGEPLPDRLNEAYFTPVRLTNMLKGLSRAVEEGEPQKLNQLLQNLREINPEKADQFGQTVLNLTKTKNILKTAKTPVEQAQALEQVGQGTSELQAAAQKSQDIAQLSKEIGVPQVRGAEVTASEESKQFIKQLSDIEDPLKNADTKATLNLIKQYNPKLAQELETQGIDIAQRLKIQGTPKTDIPFFLGLGHFARAGAGRVANLAGRTVTGTENLAASGLNQLQRAVQSSPQAFGKFAQVLQVANERGLTALGAMHFALYQNDPEYRALIDPLQKQAETEAPKE